MATKSKQYVDNENGLLDRTIFTGEQVYQEELEKVFGLAWLWVGHESLVPNPNDFFLNYMGEDPVILTRDSKNQFHVFLNMCRHRGNRVVRADDGNAKNFMCTYHGWTFSNEGKLVSVPGLQEAYYGELDVEHLGLVEARIDTYAGLIFATWAQDAPTLEAYLGDHRWYLDTHYNRTDRGMQVEGPVKWIMPCNWKAPVDNASHDHYHGMTTHASRTIVYGLFKGTKTDHLTAAVRFGVAGQRVVHASNGSGLTANLQIPGVRSGYRSIDDVASPENTRARAYRASMREEAIRRLGEHRATRMTSSSSIFPNKFLSLNLAHPRGPLATEVWGFLDYDKDTPQEMRDDLRRNVVQGGASHLTAMMAQDDMDNWRQVTESGRSLTARKYMSNISMGVGHDGPHPDYPGVTVSGRAVSETGHRGLYAWYQEFMNAESWKDIHVDPITAQFEGTATMRG